MRKPLSGKRLFEAMGRRAASKGLPRRPLQSWRHWPTWAHDAWGKGWADQQGYAKTP